MTSDLYDLVAITQAQFQAEKANLREVLEKERGLRNKVAELEERHRAAQMQYRLDASGQQVYGGDVLWQGWVVRSRRHLQFELAQVLVQKGQMIGAMQRAHGRKLASEALVQRASDDQRKALQRRQIEHEKSLQMAEAAQRKQGL